MVMQAKKDEAEKHSWGKKGW